MFIGLEWFYLIIAILLETSAIIIIKIIGFKNIFYSILIMGLFSSSLFFESSRYEKIGYDFSLSYMGWN